MTDSVEAQAREANSQENWDELWGEEGNDTWRQRALGNVYSRIVQLVPEKSLVADVGGGVGILAQALVEEKKAVAIVIDHSEKALALARAKGLGTLCADLYDDIDLPSGDVYASTECMEHFAEPMRSNLMAAMAERSNSAFISVPNDRLGPDEEPQHAVKYTAMSLKIHLLRFWEHVRVECIDGYLLGICGDAAKKNFTLSMTMPVRDEAADIERVLRSFRGVADEIVIGIDPRSKDETEEIARKYADVVFTLESPQGPPDEQVAGVHFAWVRNQCMDRCTSDWIFMTEGHEHLAEGHDALLQLDRLVPDFALFCLVLRQTPGQRWAFPWLTRNRPDLRYERHTHNSLKFPDGAPCVAMPAVRTQHDRVHAQTVERQKQRKVQNRIALMDDWLSQDSENSLFYLAQEWREYDPRRSLDFFERFIQTSNNGPQVYQAKLIVAKARMLAGSVKEARSLLMSCTENDWSRTEHWLWLGDIAFNEQKFEEAYRFYTYATTAIGEPPFTTWWIDLQVYSYLPAIRMAMVCGELGKLKEACRWAKKVAELLPEDAPAVALEEAQANVRLLEEAIHDESTD